MNEDTLVCDNCGSDQVQTKQWIWINTKKYAGDVEASKDDNWCEACQTHPAIVTHKEYEENNQPD